MAASGPRKAPRISCASETGPIEDRDMATMNRTSVTLGVAERPVEGNRPIVAVEADRNRNYRRDPQDQVMNKLIPIELKLISTKVGK